MLRVDRLCLALLLATTAAVAAPDSGVDNPIIGTWVWNPTEGQCREVHTYSADGRKRSESGEEVLVKDYHIKRVREGMYQVSEIVLSGNDKADCMGGTTPVAATAEYYLMLRNDGGYYTCASEDSMSCYGGASRLPPKS